MKPGLQQALTAISARKLETPVLLLLASHRPVAFITGQFALALVPLADLFDIGACRTWAYVLSDPDALDRLEQTLACSPQRSNTDGPSQDNSLTKPGSEPAVVHVLE